MPTEHLRGEATGKGGAGGITVGSDRVAEFGAERDREPVPSGRRQVASQGGARERSLCGTGQGCQVRPRPVVC